MKRAAFSKNSTVQRVISFFSGKKDGNREYDNPLRGMSVEKAVRLMESFNSGDYADLMWLFGAPFLGIENSDPDYLSIIERRVGALKEMNWQVRMWKPGENEPRDPAKEDLAKRQYEALFNEYDRYENLKEAIAHLEMAKFRGFSIVEPNPAEQEFIPVDHWNVRRDGMRGPWYWNESGLAGAEISACTPFRDNIIVLESKRPIGRIALLKYIRANLSEKEWDRFIEIYGVPAGVVIAPDTVNDDAKLASFRAAAAAAAKGGDAAFPFGTTYTANDSPRGIQPFQARLEWLSQKLVQAGTGGLLTMLTAPGSGTLAGSAHAEAFRTLARASAGDISEAWQRGLDKPLLLRRGLMAPGERPLAWFEISSREEQSSDDATEQVVKLSPYYKLDPKQVEERTGWKVELKPDAPTYAAGGMFRRQPAGHRADPSPTVEAADVEAAAEALMEDLAPVRDLIGEALADNGGDLKAAVAQIAAGLPGLAEKMASGKLDGVFESATAQAMADVLEAEAAKPGRKGQRGAP